MNASQKKDANKIFSQIEHMQSIIDVYRDELQEKYDGMSEKAQEGEKGERLMEEISSLSDCYDYLENAKDALGNAIGE